ILNNSEQIAKSEQISAETKEWWKQLADSLSINSQMSANGDDNTEIESTKHEQVETSTSEPKPHEKLQLEYEIVNKQSAIKVGTEMNLNGSREVLNTP